MRNWALCVGALLFCTKSGDASAQIRSSSVSDSCAVREIDRRTLRLIPDEHDLYIAPRTFVSNGKGAILLAGRPNYLFARGADGRGILVSQDSVLGAVVYENELNPRIVPAPIDAQLVTGVRALARADGAWNIVFAERDSSLHDQPNRADDPIAGLWYGVYNGVSWTLLERIPIPPNVKLSAAMSANTPLVRMTDDNSLAVAVGAQVAHASEGVIVFKRQAAAWSHEVVNTRSTAVGGLLYTESGEFLITVIAADPNVPPGGSDYNSLFLWSSGSTGWSLTRQIVRGGEEGGAISSILHPRNDGPAISWVAEVGERLHLRVRTSLSDTNVTVDDDLGAFHRFSSVALSDSSHLWVTHHGRASNSGEEPRLRFSILSREEVHSLGELPSPVLESFWITLGEREGDILLTGAIGIAETGTVVSLVVRYQLVCR